MDLYVVWHVSTSLRYARGALVVPPRYGRETALQHDPRAERLAASEFPWYNQANSVGLDLGFPLWWWGFLFFCRLGWLVPSASDHVCSLGRDSSTPVQDGIFTSFTASSDVTSVMITK
jgi:hypothetical protein